MRKLWDVLVGIGHDPVLVAAWRAFVLYVLPIVAEALIGYLTGHLTDPRFAPVIPVTVTLIRALEGALDRYFKGQRANAPRPIATDRYSAD